MWLSVFCAMGGVGVGFAELSVELSWMTSDEENCNGPFDFRTGERDGE